MSSTKQNDQQQDVHKFVLRAPGDLMARVRELSEHERRSINSQILHLIESALDELGR